MSKMFRINKFGCVDSTNLVARGFDAGNVVIGSVQTKGSGRFGRKWNSDKGGLWFSIIVNADRRAFEYTFIASLAVIESIDVKASIKWPNDIMHDNRKLCGILSELITKGDSSKVIIGIGLNVNNRIPDSLNDVAVSLNQIKRSGIELDKLLNKIVLNFERVNSLQFTEILKRYKEKSGLIGKEIRVKGVDKEISGKAVDVDNDGNLVLEVKGKRIKLNEGDVSIVR